MMQSSDERVLAADGTPLAARFFRPSGEERAKGSVLIVPAMGVSQAYYEPFADRKSTRLNSSHLKLSRMPSSA